MSGQAGDVRLADHAHPQERAEDEGVIIQKNLLHFDSDFIALVSVEGAVQLYSQLLQLITVESAPVLGGSIQTVGGADVG